MMDISTLYFAIAFFVAAAGGGLILLYRVLGDRATPKAIVIAHGLFAVTAIVLVILYTMRHTSAAPILSLVLFLLAAGGGFVLLAHDLGKKKMPKALAIIHPIAAVAGLLALIYFVLT